MQSIHEISASRSFSLPAVTVGAIVKEVNGPHAHGSKSCRWDPRPFRGDHLAGACLADCDLQRACDIVKAHDDVPGTTSAVTPAKLDSRWVEYYAEASRRRRARGWHRRRDEPRLGHPWAQRKLMLILVAVGCLAAIVAALVP
jgi:hypothetical protein